MKSARHEERGLTLTEIMVVFVLAAIVMTGLTIFYLNSQATWIDGSSQAISQREATLVLREITNRARAAASANASGSPTATLTMTLGNPSANLRRYIIAWSAGDSLLHESYMDSIGLIHSLGPMLHSRVATFAVRADNYAVTVDSLTVLTPRGSRITLATSVTMINRGAP